jgi:hypothetical protein
MKQIKAAAVLGIIVGLAWSLSWVPAGGQPEKPAPAAPAKHAGPTPGQLAKGVLSSPFNPDHRKFPRGLKRTPVPNILAAPRFVKNGVKVPAQVLMLPTQLSMWGNDQYGDCVSASEAARKAAYSVFCGLPETFIPEATVIAWASKHGYLNGANLTDVMSTAATNGMADAAGTVYLDGPYSSVDYSNEAVLQAALATGPVNLGIDANALPSGAGNNPGWYAFGGTPGQFSNEDHCVPLFGYGPTAVLFQQLSAAFNVQINPPAGAPASGYLLYTWRTIGIVDHAWLMSTVGEAWVCNPTTVGQMPGPPPPPPPPPPPGPGNATTITNNNPIPAGTWELAMPGTQAHLAQGAMLQLGGGKIRLPEAADERMKKLEVNLNRLTNIVLDLQTTIQGKK